MYCTYLMYNDLFMPVVNVGILFQHDQNNEVKLQIQYSNII